MKLYMLLVYMFTHIFKGVLFCSIHVCLRWKVEINQITFICKIDDLHHPVYFYDNYEREIAYCNIPHPSPECTPLPKQHTNVTVTQNPNKLETVVIVKGKIDQRLNGKWSCRHGTNLSEANVEINILTAKDIYTPTHNGKSLKAQKRYKYPTANDKSKEREFRFDVKCAMIIGGAIFATSVVTVLVVLRVVKLRERSNDRSCGQGQSMINTVEDRSCGQGQSMINTVEDRSCGQGQSMINTVEEEGERIMLQRHIKN